MTRDRIAAGLGLAAAPSFAAMALLTAVRDRSPAELFCMNTPAGLPIDAMVAMYALMSLFHAGPWIRRIAPR